MNTTHNETNAIQIWDITLKNGSTTQLIITAENCGDDLLYRVAYVVSTGKPVNCGFHYSLKSSVAQILNDFAPNNPRLAYSRPTLEEEG